MNIFRTLPECNNELLAALPAGAPQQPKICGEKCFYQPEVCLEKQHCSQAYTALEKSLENVPLSHSSSIGSLKQEESSEKSQQDFPTTLKGVVTLHLP